MKPLANIHPGEVLLEEFLIPLGISQNALARATQIASSRINEIVLGKRSVSADTAVRLAAALGTSERFWRGLQTDYYPFDGGQSAAVGGSTPSHQTAGPLPRFACHTDKTSRRSPRTR